MKSHDQITDRLSEYIDGELTAREQSEVETHLTACTACREAADDLRAIKAAAPRLPVVPPEHDLWNAVASRIGAPSRRPFFSRRQPTRRFSFTLPQLAAAAIAMMVLSGAMVYMLQQTGGGAGTAEPDRFGAPSGFGLSPVSLADPHYDSAIADLESALEEGRSKLDPETIAVLEENLRAIDQAIEQCRRALEADPANAFLNSHLVSARHRKLALLRTATALAMGS